MFENIKQYLAHHTTLANSDRMIRAAFVEAAKEIGGIELKLSDTSLSGRVLYVRARPAHKSELILHKAELLRALRDRFAHHAPRDIR